MHWLKNNKTEASLALLTLILSFLVYLATMAPTVPFWDCGEFIATSYTLGVPHPPGSPLYLLIGRLFSMLPTNPSIAFRVNLISPIVSALAVMFLFLIIGQLLKNWFDSQNTLAKIARYGGAFIGAMTFAFTDSHWFNAVEAEVYAFSTFLTAIVVWLILVWEEKSDQPGHERYLLLIVYIIGLAIGIHLLNLLAIFFIALVIYFKKYTVTSVGWLIVDIIVGVAAIGLIFFFFLQFKVPFELQAILTLAIFLLVYYQIYKTAVKPRFQEHARNVLMAMAASGAYLVINSGIIRGLPTIADTFGIGAVALTVIVLLAVTAWFILKKYNLLALIAMALVLIVVGYSSYTMIFVRSNQDPTIDENDPETTHQAVAYLEREQYGQRSFTDIFDRAKWKPEAAYKYKGAWDYFWKYQINYMYIRYFNWQFIGRKGDSVNPFQFILPLPFIIGLYGMVTHFGRDKHKALGVLALFLFTGLMIVLYLNQDDPQPRERDYSYVGSFFAFAIWIGIGVATLISYFSQLKSVRWRKPLTWLATIVLVIILPVNLLQANYREHDRTGNFVAWDYSYNLLQSCAPDGILFTNGDNDTFPLWYLQEVEKIRQDVKVVNLSLLNTPWYIKQLRNSEPKIAIGDLSDQMIDQINLVRWEKRKVKISPPPDSKLPPMEWEMEPTWRYGQMGALRVQDLMIMQILEANRWKRPVYFAVTVSPENKLGMDEYLQMEGLTFRIHPQKVRRINPQKIADNINNVYLFRNLNNPDVYYDDNIIRLIGNYRSAFLQLAVDRLYSNDRAGMLAALDSMSAKMPETIFPIGNDDVYLQVGLLYFEGGRQGSAEQPSDLEIRLESLLSQANQSVKNKLKYASIYAQHLKRFDKAQSILEALNLQKPLDPEIAGYLVKIYEETKQYDKALGILDAWLAVHPDDQSATAMRDRYRTQLTPAQKARMDSLSRVQFKPAS